MIRNVVSVRLRDGLSEEQQAAVDRALDGIAALRLPGQLSMSAGRDLNLREGSWDAAIVSDWADADAYRNYDTHDEHNVYRSLIAEACVDIARVQYEVQSS